MATRKPSFKDSVEKCTDIRHAYQPGLQAIDKNYSKAISPADSRLLSGSVDIDKATKAIYPEESRWDYALGYNDEAYFVEVHPAITGEVQRMQNKVKWLKEWLNKNGKPLKEISAKSPLYWIPSGRGDILKGSKQHHQISKCGIKITNRVELK